MLGARAGEDIGLQGRMGKFHIVQRVEVLAFKDVAGIFEPDLSRNGRRRACMVAGNHLHPNARRMAVGYGLDGFGTRRIFQANDPDEGEGALKGTL